MDGTSAVGWARMIVLPVNARWRALLFLTSNTEHVMAGVGEISAKTLSGIFHKKHPKEFVFQSMFTHFVKCTKRKPK